MKQLARYLKSDQLGEAAFEIYEKLRPTVARGKRGWGQKGERDLDLIRPLSRRV